MDFVKVPLWLFLTSFIFLRADTSNQTVGQGGRNSSQAKTSNVSNTVVSGNGNLPNGGVVICVGVVVALYDVVFTLSVVVAFYFYCSRRNNFPSRRHAQDKYEKCAKNVALLWRSRTKKRRDSNNSEDHHEDQTITLDSSSC